MTPRSGRRRRSPSATSWSDAGPAVFFLSDYGTVDEFVGVVHAVVHRLAPGLAVIDLSHRIPPFDIGAGSAMVVRSAPFLGAGVVLAVVDPGVGTGRRGVAIETGGPDTAPRWLVGPDNGLLAAGAAVLGGAIRAISLHARPSTFDGRDVFAPAAAHLATGGDPGALGTEVDPGGLMSPPGSPGGGPVVVAGAWGPELVASVVWIDRFGNVQLDCGPGHLDALGIAIGDTAWVAVAATTDGLLPVRRVEAFGRLGAGALGLMVDANRRIALVMDRASAAERIGLTGAGPGTGGPGQAAPTQPGGALRQVRIIGAPPPWSRTGAAEPG